MRESLSRWKLSPKIWIQPPDMDPRRHRERAVRTAPRSLEKVMAAPSDGEMPEPRDSQGGAGADQSLAFLLLVVQVHKEAMNSGKNMEISQSNIFPNGGIVYTSHTFVPENLLNSKLRKYYLY